MCASLDKRQMKLEEAEGEAVGLTAPDLLWLTSLSCIYFSHDYIIAPFFLLSA